MAHLNGHTRNMFQKSWKCGHKNSKDKDKREILKQLVDCLTQCSLYENILNVFFVR